LSGVALGFLFLDQPFDQLDRLNQDPDQADLLTAVNEVLARLYVDPGDRRLGTITSSMLVAGVAHVTPVRPHGWSIIWRVHSAQDLQVVYLGPENPG
jgi:hypothetical protein